MGILGSDKGSIKPTDVGSSASQNTAVGSGSRPTGALDHREIDRDMREGLGFHLGWRGRAGAAAGAWAFAAPAGMRVRHIQ